MGSLLIPLILYFFLQFSLKMTKHLARCGQCEGCLSPPCMKCKYCDDLYSGKPKKLKQICISRRCSVVMERQKERNLERRQHQLKRTYSVEKPINLDESSEVELSEKKSQLCGTCQVCLQPNCGLCYYCIDQTVYGGKHFSNAHCQRKVCEKLSSSVAVSNLEPESPETDAPSTSGSYCPSGKKPPMSPNKKLANPFYTPMLNVSLHCYWINLANLSYDCSFRAAIRKNEYHLSSTGTIRVICGFEDKNDLLEIEFVEFKKGPNWIKTSWTLRKMKKRRRKDQTNPVSAQRVQQVWKDYSVWHYCQEKNPNSSELSPSSRLA